jgi:hypothetical protein
LQVSVGGRAAVRTAQADLLCSPGHVLPQHSPCPRRPSGSEYVPALRRAGAARAHVRSPHLKAAVWIVFSRSTGADWPPIFSETAGPGGA